MLSVIRELEKAIEQKLKRLENYENTPKEEQGSLHYEYIQDIKDIINEYRRAIVVLKYFSLEDCKIDLGKIKLTIE